MMLRDKPYFRKGKCMKASVNDENAIDRTLVPHEIILMDPPVCKKDDILYACVPSEAAKVTDVQHRIQRIKYGLSSHPVGFDAIELSRRLSKLETIFEGDSNPQIHSLQREFPCCSMNHSNQKYMCPDGSMRRCYKYSASPYWKSTEVDNLPIRTLYRARKWVDSEEQGSQIVDDKIKGERLYSKCSSGRYGRKGGRTCMQQNNDSYAKANLRLCSCFTKNKSGGMRTNNQRYIQGGRSMYMVGKKEIRFHKSKYKCDKADDGVHLKSRMSSCVANTYKFSGDVTVDSPVSYDSKVFMSIRGKKSGEEHVIDGKSSECLYFKLNHDNKSMVVQRAAMCVPFHSQTNLKISKNCAPISENQGHSNSIPPHVGTRCVVLKKGNNYQWEEYVKPSETMTVLEREMLTLMNGRANVEEGILPKAVKHSVGKNLEKDCKEHKNHVEDSIPAAHKNVVKSEEENQEILHDVETDTLMKANDILEKIANTLNQIKSLNQSSIQSAMDCGVEAKKGLMEKFKSEESNDKTREEINIEFMKYGKNKEFKYIDLMMRKPNKKTESLVISDKLTDKAWHLDQIMERQENPLIKKVVFDGDQCQWIDKKDNVGIALSEVSEIASLKTIPLKMTNAISDFPPVEKNIVYDIPNKSAFYHNSNYLDTRRCHSIVAVINKKREVICSCDKNMNSNSSKIISTQFTCGELKEGQNSQRNEASVLLSESKLVNDSVQHESLPQFVLSCSSSSKGSSESDFNFSKFSGQESFPLDNLISQILTSWSMVISTENEYSNHIETGDEKNEPEEIIKSFECQPLGTSRLKKLSQPRVSYMKALRKELGNVLEKPVLERLNRMIKPQEKLKSDSKVQLAERSKNQKIPHKGNATRSPCGSLKKLNCRLQSPSNGIIERKNPISSVVTSAASSCPLFINSRSTSLMKNSQPVTSVCPNELQKPKGVTGKLTVPAYRGVADPPKTMTHVRRKSANRPSRAQTSLLNSTPAKVSMDCFNVQKEKHAVELAVDGVASMKPMMMHASPQSVNSTGQKHKFKLSNNSFDLNASNSVAPNFLKKHTKKVSEAPVITSKALKNQISEINNDIALLENCKHPNQSCNEPEGKNFFNALKESGNQVNLYLCHLTAAKSPLDTVGGKSKNLSSQEVNLASFPDVDSREENTPLLAVKGQSCFSESLKEEMTRMTLAAADGDVDPRRMHDRNSMYGVELMHTKMPCMETLQQKHKSVLSTEIDNYVYEECQILSFPNVSEISDEPCSGGKYVDPCVKIEGLHAGLPPSADGLISELKIKRKRCKVIDRAANLDTQLTFLIPGFPTEYSSDMCTDSNLNNGGVAKLSLAEDKPSRDDTVVSCQGNQERFLCYLKSSSEVREDAQNTDAFPVIVSQSVGEWFGEPMLNAQSGTYKILETQEIGTSVSGFIKCDEYFLTAPGSFIDQSSLNDLMQADKSSLVVVWRNDFLMAEVSQSYCNMNKGFQCKATSQEVYERMVMRNVCDRRRVVPVVTVVCIALYLMVMSLVYLPSFYI